jgi:hypothetical protein
MRPKRWKGLLLAGSLAVAIGISNTRLPIQTCVFIHEFHKTSKSGSHVSVWERIVYSLIEAKQQAT